MRYFMLNFLLLNLSFASITETDVQSINQIYESANRAVNNVNYQSDDYLERFDMQLGFSGNSGIGVLSFGANSAIELVWMKNKLKKNNFTNDLEIEVSDLNSNLEEDLFQMVVSSIKRTFEHLEIKPRFERKVLKMLKKDASRLSEVIRDLSTMPKVDGWYIDGFFKSYGISIGGKILKIVDFGYDKRIRFRFKLNNFPSQKVSHQNLSMKQKKMSHLMKSFESLRVKTENHKFKLSRVRGIHDLSGSLDLAIVELKKMRGILIEYKRDEMDFENYPANMSNLGVNKINNFILSIFDKKDYVDRFGELSLKQIRFKYGKDISSNLALVSLEKSSTLEFHYMR